MLHLGDEGVLGPVEGRVAVGQWDLEQDTAGGDEVRLHADPAVGVVEPLEAPMTSTSSAADGPHGCVGAHSLISSAFVGVVVARWKSAMAKQPRHA